MGVISRLRLLRAMWGILVLSALLLQTQIFLLRWWHRKWKLYSPGLGVTCVVYEPFDDLTYDVRQKWSFVYLSQWDTVFLYFCNTICPVLTDKAIGGRERCGFSSVVRRQVARKCIWGLKKLVTLFCGRTISKTFNYGSLRGKLCAYFICVCGGRGCKTVVRASQSWRYFILCYKKDMAQ